MSERRPPVLTHWQALVDAFRVAGENMGREVERFLAEVSKNLRESQERDHD